MEGTGTVQRNYGRGKTLRKEAGTGTVQSHSGTVQRACVSCALPPSSSTGTIPPVVSPILFPPFARSLLLGGTASPFLPLELKERQSFRDWGGFLILPPEQ